MNFDSIIEIIKDGLLVLTFLLSLCNFYLLFRFRKKDFQIAILKEQFNAYGRLIETLFYTAERINQVYKENIDAEKLLSDNNYLENIETVQRLIFVKFGDEYTASFNKFQSLIFLLPEDVMNATMKYYQCLSHLFENENDADLGIKLSINLYHKVYEVINKVRTHT